MRGLAIRSDSGGSLSEPLYSTKKPHYMTAKSKPDFGKSFGELEQIIDWFEGEEIDLDEGLKKFERGLELAQACRTQLQKVENRVNELKVKFGEQD